MCFEQQHDSFQFRDCYKWDMLILSVSFFCRMKSHDNQEIVVMKATSCKPLPAPQQSDKNILPIRPLPTAVLCFFFFGLSVKVSLSLMAWLILGYFAWISCVANLCAMCTCPPNRGLRQPKHFP